ncbi:hypothetical protein LOY46_17750 [Pseudomonas sichuanensis]|uniref:hypothetical protein n=1 Tax=Pseudomonas sichuanensis TaxID=2213015 RepID=UPI00215FF4FA|nr:hypothetical protein [Pseudomonas sichuanensis]UVK81404.1 hypothetical protein LOY46_17750 [Pseudomonas sichuanensis]
MHFDLIQTLSLAGKPDVPNDDRLGCAERHAWVIDGATDLGPAGLLGERGGAAWLAGAAQRAFAGACGPLQGICEQVFDTLPTRAAGPVGAAPRGLRCRGPGGRRAGLRAPGRLRGAAP